MAGKWCRHGLSISYCETEFCTCMSNTNSSEHTQSLIFPEKPGLTFNCPWEERKLIWWVWKTETSHSKKKQEAAKS